MLLFQTLLHLQWFVLWRDKQYPTNQNSTDASSPFLPRNSHFPLFFPHTVAESLRRLNNASQTKPMLRVRSTSFPSLDLVIPQNPNTPMCLTNSDRLYSLAFHA